MKVVHLLPAMEQGGVETVVCTLNRLLVQKGWQSVVVSRGGRLEADIVRNGGRHLRLDLKSKNPLTYITRAWTLRRILAKEKPDLVCVHSRVPAWLFVGANRALKLKWITYAHGANSVSRYSAVMTRGDRIIVPSQFLADYLKQNYAFDTTRLCIVPNAVDLTRFDPANLDTAFMDEKRHEWNLKPGEHVQMAIGRITPVKGLEEVIRALPANRRLVIVGGADKHHLKYAQHLRAIAGPNVVFAGPQTKIPECIALADEVISGNTTKPESFGLSVVEAYAMNKPVVAKPFGGVAEIMHDVACLNAPTLRDAVRELYSFERLADRTLAVYRAVLAV